MTAGNTLSFCLVCICAQVDLTYVEETAKLAKAAGVPRFSLLTAQGASPNIWGPTIKPLHSLLYAQTKGRAEEAVKAQVCSCYLHLEWLHSAAVSIWIFRSFDSSVTGVVEQNLA